MQLLASLILVAALCLQPVTSFTATAQHRPLTKSFDLKATFTSLMDDVLRGDTTITTNVVTMLTKVRGTEKMDEYLKEMLPSPKNLSWWTRLPLTRYSRRARQRRLLDLLELSTPTPTSESTVENDTDENKDRRTRRSLFILLQNMANNPESGDISSMLTLAKKDTKVGTLSPEEMIKRTPPGLETPKYEVLSTKKGFEVRQYEKFSVCSVTMNEIKSSGSDNESATKLTNPQLPGASSFGALAGYLFGKNGENKAMKMTTPVLSEGEGANRKMSFVLPSDYWQDPENKAPKPLADSSVKVSSVEEAVRAVMAFPGLGRKSDVSARAEKLRELLKTDR